MLASRRPSRPISPTPARPPPPLLGCRWRRRGGGVGVCFCIRMVRNAPFAGTRGCPVGCAPCTASSQSRPLFRPCFLSAMRAIPPPPSRPPMPGPSLCEGCLSAGPSCALRFPTRPRCVASPTNTQTPTFAAAKTHTSRRATPTGSASIQARRASTHRPPLARAHVLARAEQHELAAAPVDGASAEANDAAAHFRRKLVGSYPRAHARTRRVRARAHPEALAHARSREDSAAGRTQAGAQTNMSVHRGQGIVQGGCLTHAREKR